MKHRTSIELINMLVLPYHVWNCFCLVTCLLPLNAGLVRKQNMCYKKSNVNNFLFDQFFFLLFHWKVLVLFRWCQLRRPPSFKPKNWSQGTIFSSQKTVVTIRTHMPAKWLSRVLEPHLVTQVNHAINLMHGPELWYGGFICPKHVAHLFNGQSSALWLIVVVFACFLLQA